ncbi:MAG: hypothetical protein M1288_03680 [Actinobacteria bacterium]|nr:hypothetical protein [Actinomycetota bacterium]
MTSVLRAYILINESDLRDFEEGIEVESMQQELVVTWYQDYGEWIRRVVFGLAIAFLSYQLLSLWPAFNSAVVILCASVLGLLGA